MKLEAINASTIADHLAEMEFKQLSSFGDGQAGVFWSEAGGPSPWEMHPDCDEFLQVLEGEIEVEVLPSHGGSGQMIRVPSDSYLVVPKGCWHRQTMIEKTKEFYLTPGRSLHSSEADPRGSE